MEDERVLLLLLLYRVGVIVKIPLLVACDVHNKTIRQRHGYCYKQSNENAIL